VILARWRYSYNIVVRFLNNWESEIGDTCILIYWCKYLCFFLIYFEWISFFEYAFLSFIICGVNLIIFRNKWMKSILIDVLQHELGSNKEFTFFVPFCLKLESRKIFNVVWKWFFNLVCVMLVYWLLEVKSQSEGCLIILLEVLILQDYSVVNIALEFWLTKGFLIILNIITISCVLFLSFLFSLSYLCISIVTYW